MTPSLNLLSRFSLPALIGLALERLAIVIMICRLGTADITAADLDHWFQCFPRPSDQTLWAVASDGTNWATVGSAGTILVSPDATHWAKVAGDLTTQVLRGITFAAGRWVAVGDKGTILTSTNGVCWELHPSGTTENFYAVAYGNDRFVAVGTYGAIASSTNGLAWNMETSPNSWQPSLMSVTYGKGVFLAGGLTVLQTSSDGAHWTPQAFEPQHDIFSVWFDGQQFLAGRYNGIIFSSPDGTNWTVPGGFSAPYIRAFSKVGNTWLAAAGDLWQSQDLTNWSTVVTGAYSSTSGGGTFSVYSQAGRVLITGEAGNILISNDGTNFVQCRQGRPLGLGPVVNHAGRRVVLTTSALVLVSEDGWQWVERPFGASGYVAQNAVSDGKRIVAVGYYVPAGANEIRTSQDGIQWTSRRLASQGGLGGITCSSNGYVAVGRYGVVYTSTNGTTWKSNGIPGKPWLYSVAADGINLVALGPAGTNYFSLGNDQWTPTASATTNQLLSVVRGAGRFVAVGIKGTIVWSEDGLAWQAGSSGVRWDISRVTWAEDLFVAVGPGGMLSSADGLSWVVRSNAPSGLKNIVGRSGTFLAAAEKTLYSVCEKTGSAHAGQGVFHR